MESVPGSRPLGAFDPKPALPTVADQAEAYLEVLDHLAQVVEVVRAFSLGTIDVAVAVGRLAHHARAAEAAVARGRL